MTTININAATTKMTRVEALDWVLENVTDAPVEVVDVLKKVRDSFTKKTKAEGPSKAAQENKKLAEVLGEFVNTHFDADEPMAITARVIADNVPGIATTQKVVAVVKYADNVRREKINGKVFYVPADVEVVAE